MYRSSYHLPSTIYHLPSSLSLLFYLTSNSQQSNSGRRTLDTGHWTLDTGRWTLDTGFARPSRSPLHTIILYLMHPTPGRCYKVTKHEYTTTNFPLFFACYSRSLDYFCLIMIKSFAHLLAFQFPNYYMAIC